MLTTRSFFTTAFLNGGGVSMIYGYILAFIGALATCASMAEMASMCVANIYRHMSNLLTKFIKVPDLWRPISLGGSARAKRTGKISQLAYRMAFDIGLASRCLNWDLPRRNDHPKLANSQRPFLRAQALASDIAAVCSVSNHSVRQHRLDQIVAEIGGPHLSPTCCRIFPHNGTYRCSCSKELERFRLDRVYELFWIFQRWPVMADWPICKRNPVYRL
jgi:hypothetical protein